MKKTRKKMEVSLFLKNSSEKYQLAFRAKERYMPKDTLANGIENFDSAICILPEDILVIDGKAYVVKMKENKRGFSFINTNDYPKEFSNALKDKWVPYISIYGDSLHINYVIEKEFYTTLLREYPAIALSPKKANHVILYNTNSSDTNDLASLLAGAKIPGEAVITGFKEGFPIPLKEKELEMYLV